ncbi:MAG: hypothetical protein ACRC28_09310 [Clostridium sp.]|uniref:hypothetical protein n=1 Tax=Clostridium sp. TaxID=1506 RepID=UPI003F310582
MGISNLKSIANKSNIIERKALHELLENDNSIDFLISNSISNLGFDVKKEYYSEDVLIHFVYLDILKNHIYGKEQNYSNFQIILDHIEKVEDILNNLDSNSNIGLTNFRAWLGISEAFHEALISQ